MMNSIGFALSILGDSITGLFGDKAAVFKVALDSSIGFGKKWTMEDSLKLSATVARMENKKGNNVR